MNVTAVCLATKFAEPLLLASAASKKRTAVIFSGSLGGLIAMPQAAPYAASKWALQGFSASMFQAWKKLGIKVSVLNPGLTYTPLAVSAYADEDHSLFIHASAVADAAYFVISFHESGCPTQIDILGQYQN